ncbi:phage antirepressor Ant [Carnobacterium divergens]|uniref:phage antirepressor KilAC domain-containing protein n=1 Tax=Carnobacterium divergens TaxID=2748 RepID=UPI001073B7A3|nr:phage antirepressor KilAC domain-containing protein [Carnobacterium divergens]TFI93062.1 phage antirepressor Ant [Carnobacterium divergens]
MVNVKKFNNELFQLEVKSENGESLFNVESVARSLGITQIAKSGNEVVRWERVNRYLNLSSPQVGTVISHEVGKNDFISEPMVYKLAFKANNPLAEKFQDWLAIEVLPSIRKNGMYATDELLDNPDLLIEVATKLKEERTLRLVAEQRVTELKPKALFADAVDASKTSILIGDLAKLIKQNGVDIGQNRLFKWLRGNGYLIARKGESYNMPTQRSLDLGIVEIKERTHNNPDGSIRISRTPKVTGKGQIYFVNKFLNHELQLA